MVLSRMCIELTTTNLIKIFRQDTSHHEVYQRSPVDLMAQFIWTFDNWVSQTTFYWQSIQHQSSSLFCILYTNLLCTYAWTISMKKKKLFVKYTLICISYGPEARQPPSIFWSSSSLAIGERLITGSHSV